MSKVANLIIFSMFLLACTSSAAPALEPGHSIPGNGLRGAHIIRRGQQEYKTEKLPSPVSLPGLPSYTGKARYVTGGVMPNVTGGSTCYMRFNAREKADVVMNWYQDVFRQQGWVVDSAVTTGTAVAAVYNTYATCQVVSVPSSSPEYKTEFIIEYKYLHTQKI